MQGCSASLLAAVLLDHHSLFSVTKGALCPRVDVMVSSLGNVPLSNSWIIVLIWLCKALNRTPNIDSYWVGGCTQVLALVSPPCRAL